MSVFESLPFISIELKSGAPGFNTLRFLVKITNKVFIQISNKLSKFTSHTHSHVLATHQQISTQNNQEIQEIRNHHDIYTSIDRE